MESHGKRFLEVLYAQGEPERAEQFLRAWSEKGEPTDWQEQMAVYNELGALYRGCGRFLT